MLLTSSQVSAVISSGVVFVFTAMLFIAGLFLQHQSVKNLNAVLHPSGGRKGPWEQLVARAEFALAKQQADALLPPASFAEDNVRDGFVKEIFEGITGPGPEAESDIQNSKGGIIFETTEGRGAWDRRAYVQIVRHADEVCGALANVVSLSVQGSPARRILVYPRAWNNGSGAEEASETGQGNLLDTPEADLIRTGQREHLLETFTLEGLDAGNATGLGQGAGKFLMHLTGFDRLVFLQSAGLVLNASRLDGLFELDMDPATTVAGVDVGGNGGEEEEEEGNVDDESSARDSPAVLLQPGADEVAYSKVDLRGAERATQDTGRAWGAEYASVETTRTLAKMQWDVSRTRFGEEDPLLKIGYVMISPEAGQESDEDGGRWEQVNGELRKRAPDAVVAQTMDQDSLVRRFLENLDVQKKTVCANTAASTRREDVDIKVDL